ncbi:hypothetical protein HDU92_000021 [Lobulomyces angularis]|nr:hypothetical protein HDU92_000021 [Lobulomyces angularis]
MQEEFSPFSCERCRIQKRKCNKKLPSCKNCSTTRVVRKNGTEICKYIPYKRKLYTERDKELELKREDSPSYQLPSPTTTESINSSSVNSVNSPSMNSSLELTNSISLDESSKLKTENLTPSCSNSSSQMNNSVELTLLTSTDGYTLSPTWSNLNSNSFSYNSSNLINTSMEFNYLDSVDKNSFSIENDAEKNLKKIINEITPFDSNLSPIQYTTYTQSSSSMLLLKKILIAEWFENSIRYPPLFTDNVDDFICKLEKNELIQSLQFEILANAICSLAAFKSRNPFLVQILISPLNAARYFSELAFKEISKLNQSQMISVETLQSFILLSSFFLQIGSPDPARKLIGDAINVAFKYNWDRPSQYDTESNPFVLQSQFDAVARRLCWAYLINITTLLSSLYNDPLILNENDYFYFIDVNEWLMLGIPLASETRLNFTAKRISMNLEITFLYRKVLRFCNLQNLLDITESLETKNIIFSNFRIQNNNLITVNNLNQCLVNWHDNLDNEFKLFSSLADFLGLNSNFDENSIFSFIHLRKNETFLNLQPILGWILSLIALHCYNIKSCPDRAEVDLFFISRLTDRQVDSYEFILLAFRSLVFLFKKDPRISKENEIICDEFRYKISNDPNLCWVILNLIEQLVTEKRKFNTTSNEEEFIKKRKLNESEGSARTDSEISDRIITTNVVKNDFLSTSNVSIQTRLNNISEHLKMSFDDSLNIFERLKAIEDKIIQLENDFPAFCAYHFNQPNSKEDGGLFLTRVKKEENGEVKQHITFNNSSSKVLIDKEILSLNKKLMNETELNEEEEEMDDEYLINKRMQELKEKLKKKKKESFG